MILKNDLCKKIRVVPLKNKLSSYSHDPDMKNILS